jgi:hypothetical protein
VHTGRLAVAVLLLGVLLPLLGGAPALARPRAAPAAQATPLTVRLVRLTPSAIPVRGRIVLAGTVTNSSEENWSAVNVSPFISQTPMTTRDELAAAAATPEDTEVGKRLYGPGQFTTVGDIAPGQTVPFTISLKVKELPISGDPGVYWIGVHALGQNAEGRDGLADGRARTFIPLVRGRKHTSVAVVVPVREAVRRDADGRVVGTTGWSDSLAPTGRLGRLGGFITSAGAHATSLLVDPAVLDAVGNLEKGNPELSLGSAETAAQGPGSSPSATTPVSRSADRLDPSDRANAAAWLGAMTTAERGHTVLGLGYDDPDASALLRRRPALFDLATKLAAQTFGSLGITALPTVAPADGWLDDDALPQLPAESMVLVSDHAAPRDRTQWRTASPQDLVFTDAQAASGGPAPSPPLDALALRQRIISDAALRLREGAGGTMVVELPADWDPGPAWQLADFFNQLDTSWLDLTGVSGSTDASTPRFDAVLGYPAAQRQREIPAANIGSTRGLVATTTVLSQLLRSKNDVAHDLAGVALDAVSYHARTDPVTARLDASATNARMRALLDKVQVLGTDFVTLSGGSGTLAVTLVNGLDQPVTVGVAPRSSTGDVKIEDVAPLAMAPGQRTVLRLKAQGPRIGVTQVVLSPVTADGLSLGSPLTFSLRTSEVGRLIWGVLLAGSLLLVVMIGLRVRRALREHRWRRA